MTPAWFSDYVLTVGAVTPDGLPMPDSIAGPWVSVAAPGYRIMGLSSTNGAPVNALPDNNNPGTGNGYWGTSFSAAYVSGIAALVRAKFPNLTSHQVIRRITATAHNPAQGVDNQVGYGVVDPVAALTFDVGAGDPKPAEQLSTPAAGPADPAAPGHPAAHDRAGRGGAGAGRGGGVRRGAGAAQEDDMRQHRRQRAAAAPAAAAVVALEVVALAVSGAAAGTPVRLVARRRRSRCRRGGAADHRGPAQRRRVGESPAAAAVPSRTAVRPAGAAVDVPCGPVMCGVRGGTARGDHDGRGARPRLHADVPARILAEPDRKRAADCRC